MDTYLDFCKRCSQGMVGYRKDFYVLSDKYGDNKNTNQNRDISIVNPTQAAVDQAKSEVKNQKTINRTKKLNYNQTGGKSGKKKTTRSKKKVVVKKIKNQGLPRRKKINPVKIIKKERLEKVHQKVTDHYGCSANISVAIHSTSH